MNNSCVYLISYLIAYVLVASLVFYLVWNYIICFLFTNVFQLSYLQTTGITTLIIAAITVYRKFKYNK